jgi:hypothetical protein
MSFARYLIGRLVPEVVGTVRWRMKQLGRWRWRYGVCDACHKPIWIWQGAWSSVDPTAIREKIYHYKCGFSEADDQWQRILAGKRHRRMIKIAIWRFLFASMLFLTGELWVSSVVTPSQQYVALFVGVCVAIGGIGADWLVAKVQKLYGEYQMFNNMELE